MVVDRVREYMSYSEALERIKFDKDLKTRLEHWNEDSYIALHNGLPCMHLDNQPRAFSPSELDRISPAWYIMFRKDKGR